MPETWRRKATWLADDTPARHWGRISEKIGTKPALDAPSGQLTQAAREADCKNPGVLAGSPVPTRCVAGRACRLRNPEDDSQ